MHAAKDGIPDAVSQLACHIVADVALGRRVTWQSASEFSAGIREYSICLYTKRRVTMHLRRAEQHFIEALAVDRRFTLAYYNLGVVYRALAEGRMARDAAEKARDLGAADSAFERAIEADPNDWRPYYSLALNRNDVLVLEPNERRSAAIAREISVLCERVLAIDPSNAQALDLAGRAAFELGDGRLTRRYREAAVTAAWRDLLRTELTSWRSGGRRSAHARRSEIARECLQNLALTYAVEAKNASPIRRPLRFLSSTWTLRQALGLRPSDPSLLASLAVVYRAWGRNRRWIEALRRVVGVEPNDARHWAQLATAYGRARRPQDARDAFELAYRCLARLERSDQLDQVLETLVDASVAVGSFRLRRRARAMRSLLRRLGALPASTPAPAVFERLYNRYLARGRWWESALIAHYLELGAAASADRTLWCRRGVTALEQASSAADRVHGLHARLARYLSAQGQRQDAAVEAELGLRLDPVGMFERQALAETRASASDAMGALDALKGKLSWAPEDARTFRSLAFMQWIVAQGCGSRAARRIHVDEATANLRQALELLPDRGSLEAIAIRYWLGRFLLDVGEFEEALGHFEAVAGLGVAWPLPQFLLGLTQLRLGLHTRAIETFQSATDAVRPRMRNGLTHASHIGTEFDDSWLFANLHALLKWGTAYVYVLEGVRLDEAVKMLELADRIAARYPTDTKMAQQACAEARGWARYQSGDVDGALAELERAAAISPDPETFFHLARAAARKLADLSGPGVDATPLRRRLENWLDQVETLDNNGTYGKAVSDIRSASAARPA